MRSAENASINLCPTMVREESAGRHPENSARRASPSFGRPRSEVVSCPSVMATVGPKRPRLALPELGVSRRKRAISPSLASARRTDSSEAARLQRKDRLGAVTFSPEASLGGLAHTTRDEWSAAGWGMRSKAGSASSSTFGGGSFERRTPASRSGSRPVSPRSRNGPGRKAVDFSWSEFEARIALSSPHIGSGVPPSPASSISASPATRQSPRGTGASPATRQSPHRRYKYSSSPLTSSPALLTRSRGARAAAQTSLRARPVTSSHGALPRHRRRLAVPRVGGVHLLPADRAQGRRLPVRRGGARHHGIAPRVTRGGELYTRTGASRGVHHGRDGEGGRGWGAPAGRPGFCVYVSVAVPRACRRTRARAPICC